jgi:acyl-CoA synthetase (AMP-forming)/AMP-acid ligase II
MNLSDLLASADSARPAFVTLERTTSWGEWQSRIRVLAEQWAGWRGARVGVALEPNAEAYAAFVALGLAGADVYLLDHADDRDAIRALSERCELDALAGFSSEFCDIAERPGRNRAPSEPARITIFTSGSTGQPKAVGHTWQTLSRPVRRSAQETGRRWLLTYRPRLYAGLQVFFQCFVNQGTLALPPQNASVADIVLLLDEAGVECASATPSYWRRLLTFADAKALARLKLRQITLGGEVVDQVLLDGLRRAFPGVRLVHIYATSEMGRCFSVTDGLAGFPATLLDGPSADGIALKIMDNELFVRSANAMVGERASDVESTDTDAWFATGDLVERAGDRVLFAGRRTELINVGGNKVNPLLVEQAIQAVPGVLDVRVFAKKSSLVGQMVACELVVAEGCDAADVRARVQERCRERLAAHERPRFIELVPAITLSSAAKKIRGA